MGFDDGTNRSLVVGLYSDRRVMMAGLAECLFIYLILFRFGWGSLLRWVCVGSGWVYCFGFVVDS